MRLPATIRHIGDVCLSGPRPYGPASLAHRLSYYITRERRDKEMGQGFMAAKPRCVTPQEAIDAGERYGELSAHRADQLDIPACPRCF